MSCNLKSCGNQCSSGGCNHSNHKVEIDKLPKKEVDFLMYLAQYPFLPVVSLLMRSSSENEVEVATLEPVFLEGQEDSLDKVKEIGKILYSLRYKGLITIDYDKPLDNGKYSLFEQSAIYEWFVRTVTETGDKSGIIYDKPVMERGSLALTLRGQEAIEELGVLL